MGCLCSKASLTPILDIDSAYTRMSDDVQAPHSPRSSPYTLLNDKLKSVPSLCRFGHNIIARKE